MKKASSTVKKIFIIVGLALGAFAISAVADYTAPTFSFPDCPDTVPGCHAPINTGGGTTQGNYTQIKSGPLTLQGLLSVSNFLFNPSGQANIIPGSVLTAKSNDGVVMWAPVREAILTCGPVVPTGGQFTGYVELPLIDACTTTGGCRLQVIRDGVNIDGSRTIRYIQGASGLSGNNWVSTYGDNGENGDNGDGSPDKIGAGMGSNTDYEFYDDSDVENTSTSITFRDNSNKSYSAAVCP